ncbi:hypothetical protein CRM22_001157 [Opisthorchis felineus]|uniref:Uncharacterized protein n=1 Tax=Opisthorchis felineus TaxID=147828 RepID=A0A4S2MBU8_OPIFE|nr:hypothetical protein CRM22_001157 [Opisthorchis felineus]
MVDAMFSSFLSVSFSAHPFRNAVVCHGLSGSDHSNMITWWAYFSRVFMGVGMPIGDNERIRGGFYRGSRFLEPLAEFMHVPLDQINFVVSGLLSIVFGLYLMRRRYAPENVTPRFRAVIESILGLFLLYFCFGNQLRVLLLQSTVAYILMLFLPQSRLMAVVVTLWVMFYMTLVHLCRWQYDYGGYTLDISGPVMVQTQRLSSLAFNLADGFVLRERERRVATKQAAVSTTMAPGKLETLSNPVSPGEMTPIDYAQASMQSFKSMLVRGLKSFTDVPSRRLSERPASINGVSVQTYLDRLLARTTQSSPQHHASTQTDLVTRMSSTQIEHAVYTVPGPVEFFAYNLYFHGACVGPFVFFSEYQTYLEGYQKHRVPRIDWRYVCLVFVRTTVVGLLSAYLSPYFPFDYVLSDAFAKSPLLERILYTTVSLFLVRQKYYFAWGLSELGGISAGLGYTGICPNTGRPQYAGVRNFDVFQIECGLGLKNVIDSWNISTTRWLREVFYERLPYFCRTFLVFIISAFWHGFYPGYYLMFVTFALFTFVSRMWRRAMRPFCRQTVLSSCIYDVFTAILTNLVINYAQAPFHLLDWSASLIFWSAFNFVPHLSALFLLFVHFIRPRLMRSVRSGRHRFPFSHGRTVGG